MKKLREELEKEYTEAKAIITPMKAKSPVWMNVKEVRWPLPGYQAHSGRFAASLAGEAKRQYRHATARADLAETLER